MSNVGEWIRVSIYLGQLLPLLPSKVLLKIAWDLAGLDIWTQAESLNNLICKLVPCLHSNKNNKITLMGQRASWLS